MVIKYLSNIEMITDDYDYRVPRNRMEPGTRSKVVRNYNVHLAALFVRTIFCRSIYATQFNIQCNNVFDNILWFYFFFGWRLRMKNMAGGVCIFGLATDIRLAAKTQ